MTHAIIDRFEGDYAVIEYCDATFDFPRVLLPGNAKEGDVLKFHIEVDTTGTQDRRKTIRDLEDELFQ